MESIQYIQIGENLEIRNFGTEVGISESRPNKRIQEIKGIVSGIAKRQNKWTP